MKFYPEWLRNIEFMPHITVGNVINIEIFENAIEETNSINEVFETTVEAISVEIIAENEDSIIELNIPIRG